jgi:hypothetical protein
VRPSTTPATYWRRRAVVLAAGAGLLTLLAWTVNGILAGAVGHRGAAGRSAQAADRGAAARTHAQRRADGGAAQPARHNRAAPSPAVSGPGVQPAGGTRSPQSLAVPARGPTGLLPAPGSGAADLASHPPQMASNGYCSRAQLVLSIFTHRYWYLAGQKPVFVVTVVSTSRQPCKFNVGARQLAVAVTGAHGQLWSSADCVQGGRSQVVSLRRGVPAVVWISWNRRTSAPGCLLASRRVHRGTFTATATARHLQSKGLIFVLSAPGLAVP